MRDTILIPLDGSDLALAALTYAERIPSRAVTLLHVVPTLPPFVDVALVPEERAVIDAYLEGLDNAFEVQGRTVTTVIERGDPSDILLRHAEAADLVVMTTRGRGAGGRLLHGSVADRMARHSPTPTIFIHPTIDGSAPTIERIVIGLDGSALAESVLAPASALAKDLGVPVHLVRALDDQLLADTARAGVFAAYAYEQTLAEARDEAESYLSGVRDRLAGQGLTVTTATPGGTAADELMAATSGSDLLAITTHGRSGFGRWLIGSVAEKLVRFDDAPVLVVRPGESA